MLQQNVRAFRDIAASPSLRSEMAGAMVQLLKDPKITKELEKMIKLMLAKEMRKLQAKMLMMMQKMQQQQLRQQKIGHPKHHSSKKQPTAPSDEIGNE